ncbi:MAG: hypothetical protein R3350_07545, partial [Saprospiraceae bacterium]|nr:hypothetical protein [Saprospiraceae bacterium]
TDKTGRTVVEGTLDGRPTLLTEWREDLFFICEDADSTVRVEMRLVDEAGNLNSCQVDVSIKDQLRPQLTSVPRGQISCREVPENPYDTLYWQQRFGKPQALDNCGAFTVELTPQVDLNSCGAGTIVRRFKAIESNRSSPLESAVVSQSIEVLQESEYILKFPADVDDLGCSQLTADSLEFLELGCDMIAVSYEDQKFTPTGDECYKLIRTYRVINFCEYDGFSDPVVIGRDPDCDGVPGEENIHLIRRPDGTAYLDRDEDENNSFPAAKAGCNPQGYWYELPSTGYWEYTQEIKVYDREEPNLRLISSDISFCSGEDSADRCEGPASFDISVTDVCSPENIILEGVSVDLFREGTFEEVSTAVISGGNPFLVEVDLPIGNHALKMRAVDACGNVGTLTIPVEIRDCYIAEPSCVDSYSIQLQPIDANRDGSFDGGTAVVWADSLVAGTLADCSDISYSINRQGRTPHPDSVSLRLSCADTSAAGIPVELWAWDGAGNSTFCLSSIVVGDDEGFCKIPKTSSIQGEVHTEWGEPIEGVELQLEGETIQIVETGSDGSYRFDSLSLDQSYTIFPFLNKGVQNGVSTIDMIIISKHILGVKPLGSPYQMIAADVNKSQTITTLDLIKIRKLILSLERDFAGNTSWRFVKAAYQFPQNGDPLRSDFPELFKVEGLPVSGEQIDIVGIKVGDVNGSARPSLLTPVEPRTYVDDFYIELNERRFESGERFAIDLHASDIGQVLGFQATLEYDPQVLEFEHLEHHLLDPQHLGLNMAERGLIGMSWYSLERVGEEDPLLFRLWVKSKTSGRLSDHLKIGSTLTSEEAYDRNERPLDIRVRFVERAAPHFALHQNHPNPFGVRTFIPFDLPSAQDVQLTIMNARGITIYEKNAHLPAGQHKWEISRKDLPSTGLFYYRLQIESQQLTRRMLLVE